MKDITIVYRGNDLYNDLIPVVISVLTNFGYTVETIEFDRSANRKSIEKKLNGQRHDLEKTSVIADQTCRFPLKDIDADVELILGYSDLDKIFDSVITELIKSENGSSDFVKAFKAIEPKNRPDTVQVTPNHLTDHDPFSDMNSAEAINQLQRWFKEAGYEARVEEAKSGLAKEWFIADRHSDAYKFVDGFAVVLGLPLSNFIQDASRCGLLSVDDDRLKGVLSTKLRGYLGEVGRV